MNRLSRDFSACSRSSHMANDSGSSHQARVAEHRRLQKSYVVWRVQFDSVREILRDNQGMLWVFFRHRFRLYQMPTL